MHVSRCVREQRSLFSCRKMSFTTKARTAARLPYTETADKLNLVLRAIHEDILGCECLLSILSGAIMSYRIDSVLRPYPPMFMKMDGEKDIDKLRETLNRTPRLRDMGRTSVDSDVIDLLHWCFCSLPFKVISRDKSLMPGADYLLEFVPSEQQERLFEKARLAASQSPLISAYHGTKIENVFSILNCGLLTYMNKVGIFGSGTYLTTEQRVAQMFTNRGPVWPRSSLGSHLRCVVVCDTIADHPDVRWTENNNKQNKHNVPDKYILVKNNSVLKVRYLMLYATKAPRQQGTPATLSPSRSRLWSFARNNISFLALMMYGFVLLCINLPSCKPLKQIWSKMYHNFE